METHYEVRNRKIMNRNYSSVQSNNNLSSKNRSNRYAYINSSQESLSNLSSNECRPATHPTLGPPVRQRFSNLSKYLHKRANGETQSHKNDEHLATQTQQISTDSSPFANKTNSTILLANTDDDQIVYEYVDDSVSKKTPNKSRVSTDVNASSIKSFYESVADESFLQGVVLADETDQKLQSNSRLIAVDSDKIGIAEDFCVEHHQDHQDFEKHKESAAILAVSSEESIEDIETQVHLIYSDNESNSTNEAVDEVDFVKCNEQATVSSVKHFSVRPRFSKLKVSPTKIVTQNNSNLKIKEQHLVCLQQLDSSNWNQIIIGLQTFLNLVRNNPEQIEPKLHKYCLALSKNIKNLRSQVSRASCQAAGEFFESHSKLLEQEADDLALALFNRTADTNKFLRFDATKALRIMCETLPIPKIIQIVTSKGATHQNSIVRTVSANLCNQIIARCGADKIFSMNRDLRDKFIVTSANLLLEGSLDTRNFAKMFFKQLSHHPSYHITLQEVIPNRTYRNIEKTLKNIN